MDFSVDTVKCGENVTLASGKTIKLAFSADEESDCSITVQASV